MSLINCTVTPSYYALPYFTFIYSCMAYEVMRSERAGV